MSVLWDELGQKLRDGTLTRKEVYDVMGFLEDFDNVHANTVFKYAIAKHKIECWVDFDLMMSYELVTKDTLARIISDLHSFDHENDEILMRSFYKSKTYWRNHKIYKTVLGTFRNGVWE